MADEKKEEPQQSESPVEPTATLTPAWKRPFKWLGKVIGTTGDLAKALLVIGTLSAIVIGFFVQSYKKDREKKALYERCNNLIENVRAHVRKDQFDQAQRILDGQVPEFKALVDECNQNQYLKLLRREVSLFKIASEYDQFTLVDGSETLQDIESVLSDMRNMQEPSDVAELDTLRGVLADLRDRPNDAEVIYQAVEKSNPHYPNLFNNWGYTIFRWRMGGGDWAERALEKFARAASLSSDSPWPQINSAAVYLSLAEDEMEMQNSRDGEVAANLRKAKESLERAESILKANADKKGGVPGFTKPPRVSMLLARLYLIQGQDYQKRKRTPDAEKSFYTAETYLLDAQGVNDKVVDIPILLGAVYEELWLAKNSPEMQERAIDAFKRAVKLDDKNLEALMKLAYCLYRHKNPQVREEGAMQAERGESLIQDYRRNLRERLMETGNPDAQNWLHNRLDLLDKWEVNFRKMKTLVTQMRP